MAGDYIATLVVNDGTDDSAPDSFTVTATAVTAVTAVDDTASTDSDEAVTIDVLANDAPAGVTVKSIISQPANGVAVLNANDTITYSQDGLALESEGLNLYKTNCQQCHTLPGFNGTDTFEYEATNGNSSDIAMVTVEVDTFDPIDFSQGTTHVELNSMIPLTACFDLPSINPHKDCLGLSNDQIKQIGDFVQQGFDSQVTSFSATLKSSSQRVGGERR